jgi:hypothetical protein
MPVIVQFASQKAAPMCFPTEKTTMVLLTPSQTTRSQGYKWLKNHNIFSENKQIHSRTYYCLCHIIITWKFSSRNKIR